MQHDEEAFIRRFLIAAYRERYLAKKGIPRQDLWHTLVSKLRASRTVELPNNVHVPSRFLPVLPKICSVDTGMCISAHSELDATRIAIDDSLDHEGTIVSFIPGKLALYQSEASLPRTYQAILTDSPAMKARVASMLDAASTRFKRLDRGH